MGMEFCSFSSGSSGNCYLVKTEHTGLLVDAGISAKKIKEGLASVGMTPGKIHGLLITHEHSDHIKCVSTLLRQNPQLSVFLNAETRAAGDIKAEADRICEIESNGIFTIGDIAVTVFSVSHDAADPVGYSLRAEGKQITILTDTGYVPEALYPEIGSADLLVLESNYDSDMLKIGRYPWFLKQRIAGEKGHLSNEDAGAVLQRLSDEFPKPRHVLLGHLSKENNFPDMAYQTVKNMLEEKQYYIGKHLELELLLRDEIGSLIRV